MTLASASLEIVDGGIGSSRVLSRPPAVVGCSSSGTEDEPVLISSSEDAVTEFGHGRLAELIALYLKIAGGPVLACKAATVTAGARAAGCATEGAGTAAAGTLSAGGGNTSTAVPALTGTPLVPHAVLVEVVTAGSNIAANPAVRVSIDGGIHWYADDATNVSATPTAIGDTGLLLAWTDGTFVDGDTWTAYGANGASHAEATGASVPTFSGTPVDAYDVRVKVTRATTTAGNGEGAVRYSLDGGVTYQPEQPVPANRAVVLGNSGLTATFSAASMVAGDIYHFWTAAPEWDATTLAAALAALAASSIDHEFPHIAEPVTATTAATLKTSVEGLATAGIYRWGLASARDQGATLQGETSSAWQTALLGASPGFNAFNSKLVAITAGAAMLAALDGSKIRRPVAWVIGPRLAKLRETSAGSGLAEHPGRVDSGALEGIEQGDLIHDLRVLTSLPAGRFMGAQSFTGRSGYFATSTTMAQAGSDYRLVMNVRVVVEGSRVGINRLQNLVNRDFRTATGGVIDRRDAAAVDAYLTGEMVNAMVETNLASAATAQVNRTDNLLSTENLRAKLRIRPKGYATTITATIGLTSE